MRINEKLIEYSNHSIRWKDVEALRQTSGGLMIKLKDGQQIVLKDIHQTVADQAFRIFNAQKSRGSKHSLGG